IVNFYEALAAPAAAPAIASAPAAPAAAGAPAAPAAATPPPSQQLSLVVLLDDQHLNPHERKRTLDRLAPVLESRLAAGDRLMLASLDRSLRIVRGFDALGPLAGDLATIDRH